jgi:hypothetical protein
VNTKDLDLIVRDAHESRMREALWRPLLESRPHIESVTVRKLRHQCQRNDVDQSRAE